MAESTTFTRTLSLLGRHRGLLLPLVAAGLVFVILVPLPPALMDVLLVTNIALAAVILLTTIYVSSPLEFSVFPSVLLGATLVRLVLNVATTRLILTAGGSDASASEAQLAAGKVIWAFSSFVTSGSLAVGVILFAILIVIQFVVVTRGAGRISEVAARFVLDAMPGKQMAIDADLNANLIDADEARRRRRTVAREAEFYGAMDGASKFLRGDAIAAVLITAVNILGGLYVGLVQQGWDLSRTATLFSRLTIGDGLVTQIPAFIVSISAALLITRSPEKTNLGEEVLTQLVSRPIVLIITAGFLAALTLTPLPAAPLALLGVGCVGLAWLLSRRDDDAGSDGENAQKSPIDGEDVEALLAVDPVRLDVGYALTRLADPASGGDLLERIAALRRQMALELGFVLPPVRIRDDMRIEANGYVIRLRGVKVAAGRVYPRQRLAVGGESVTGKLIGRDTTEPAFGTPAVWIDPAQRERAERMNYAVVEPSAVLMTHLAELLRTRAADLLSRRQVMRLLENLRARAGGLADDVTARFRTGRIQKVLQGLLRERVAIRDLEAICEAMDDYAGDDDDVDALIEHVRASLGAALCQNYCGADGKLWCVSLTPELEDAIASGAERTSHGRAVLLEPTLARRIAGAVDAQAATLRRKGRRPVLLCSPTVRASLSRLIAPAVRDVAVLGYNEIESVEVETVSSVGIDQ